MKKLLLLIPLIFIFVFIGIYYYRDVEFGDKLINFSCGRSGFSYSETTFDYNITVYKKGMVEINPNNTEYDIDSYTFNISNSKIKKIEDLLNKYSYRKLRLNSADKDLITDVGSCSITYYDSNDKEIKRLVGNNVSNGNVYKMNNRLINVIGKDNIDIGEEVLNKKIVEKYYN